MKTKADLITKMEALGACPEAVEWVQASPHNDFDAIWNTCERGDWMLWFAARVLDRKTVVRAACWCAREALVHVPVDEFRPLSAIDMAEAWTRGEVSVSDVQVAANAAYAAAAHANKAETHAALGAWIACAAAVAPARAAHAAAAYAVCAAASATYAAASAAHSASLRRSADLVRSAIGAEMFAETESGERHADLG